jgi:DNA-binding transcriptional MocR family regulator
MRADLLEQLAARERLALVYTMPTCQNPTGLTMTLRRRREILEVAARHDIPVLEDHFDAELRYEGRPVPPLKALDGREQVVLLGTFSKILFPGLRVGWVVAPRPLYQALLRLKQATALATSLLPQVALAEFCRRGLLEAHLRRVREVYARRRRVLLETMARSFPREVTWTRPEGGMTLWVTLPRGASAVAVAMEARRRGVLVAPGTLFFLEGGQRYLALSSTVEPEERLRRGARILGEILAGEIQRIGGVGREETRGTPFV